MVPPRLSVVSDNSRGIDVMSANDDADNAHERTVPDALSDPEAAVDRLSKAARREKLRRLEALLFASTEPVDAKSLMRCLDAGDDVNALLKELQDDYKDRGVALVRVAGR